MAAQDSRLPIQVTSGDYVGRQHNVAGGRQRFGSLDGLRGVGALVVVLYHAMLVIPAISALHTVGKVAGVDPEKFSPEWWVQRTPLRLLWGGHEAVLLFFVLSGFVLTLPLIGRRPASGEWASYYARRLIRLYVPVWGALVFALVLALVIHRQPDVGSTWMQAHPQPSARSVLRDSFLLLGTSNLNSPLWSLRWEVWFSLLLPVLLFLLRVVRVERWWLPAVVALCVISSAAQLAQVKDALPQAWLSAGLLQYMPVFGIGMILALKLPVIANHAHRIISSGRAGMSFTLLGVGALLLAASPRYVNFGAPVWVDVVLDTVSLLGVALIILLALEARRFKQFLNTAFMRWAGSRSFSIYLVHEPVLVAVALLARPVGAAAWLPWAAVSIALALGAAEIFSRLVELPAHRLSRRVGALVDRVSSERRRP